MQSSSFYQPNPQQYLIKPTIINESNIDDDEDSDEVKVPNKRSGRRKIKIEYILDKTRRHITFSKRKAGIMKKAYELSTLTGTQVLLLVVSETGLVYTFTTPKLQPLVTKPEGKNLIQSCLNAPDLSDPLNMKVPESSSTSPTSTKASRTTINSSPKTNNTNFYQPNQTLDSNTNYLDERKGYGNVLSTTAPLILNNTNDLHTNYNPMGGYNNFSTQPSNTGNNLYPYNLQSETEYPNKYWNQNISK